MLTEEKVENTDWALRQVKRYGLQTPDEARSSWLKWMDERKRQKEEIRKEETKWNPYTSSL